MDDEPKLVPHGPLADEPIYTDAHLISEIGDTMTMWFLRIPPAFTEEQKAAREAAHPGELHAKTIAAVTMMKELALKMADSIYRLAGKTPPGDVKQ